MYKRNNMIKAGELESVKYLVGQELLLCKGENEEALTNFYKGCVVPPSEGTELVLKSLCASFDNMNLFPCTYG
jgi:hypothetical protein